MNLFDDIIKEIKIQIEDQGKKNNKAIFNFEESLSWPHCNSGNIVLKSDTAVEIGSPEDESVSYLLWTGDEKLIKNNTITLIGNDLKNSESLPFGKIVLLQVEGFDTDNCYDRHKELELMRHELNLKGYMMRAASQYMREWSRISKEAIKNGFSFFTLGNELVKLYKSRAYVKAVEIIFITSSSADVVQIRHAGEKAEKLISAMNKMNEELSLDCDACDYVDICSDVSELRTMRDSKKRKNEDDQE
jgi:CO dehydrogenase/acetyl-CoA synthase beta subunit